MPPPQFFWTLPHLDVALTLTLTLTETLTETDLRNEKKFTSIMEKIELIPRPQIVSSKAVPRHRFFY